ncbi:hypothetical protein GQ53DRAFT_289855 [Thozetella sp. PMI_491]|nr:hypothetical protein GQ53DRAFT_289855 [Thozetella sp. PMI_491]
MSQEIIFLAPLVSPWRALPSGYFQALSSCRYGVKVAYPWHGPSDQYPVHEAGRQDMSNSGAVLAGGLAAPPCGELRGLSQPFAAFILSERTKDGWQGREGKRVERRSCSSPRHPLRLFCTGCSAWRCLYLV